MKSTATSLGVSEFKAHALEIFDRVSRTGESVIVTRRGKPLARVVAFTDDSTKPVKGGLAGTVTFLGDLVAPLGDDDWEACQ
jgi:prevent-host-death family protein